EALAAIPAMQVEQHRAEELTLIDDAIADLWPIAHDHTQPRTALEARESVRRWAELKATLPGLDAPVRVSVDAEQLGRELDAFIAALTAADDDDATGADA